jgi:signal transduction histidine kinase
MGGLRPTVAERAELEMTQRGWFWLIFLILIVGLLAVLATRFNVAVLLADRRALLEPILGTVGFVIILAGFIILFVRLTQEMRLNQLQSEFLAAVTHELKTPIATLELSSSLLRQTDLLPTEQEQLWRSHDVELGRLRSEVEALLEAARWDAKAVRSKRIEIDLEKWLNEHMIAWREVLGSGGSLTRTGDSLPSKIYADPKMLEIVCTNLVENAKKFARGKPRLTLRTEFVGSKWKIAFQDEGLGFESSEAKKIFKRFYRAKHSAPYSIAGTGLGLYLARAAGKRMGIAITGSSGGPEKGAIFALSGKASG